MGKEAAPLNSNFYIAARWRQESLQILNYAGLAPSLEASHSRSSSNEGIQGGAHYVLSFEGDKSRSKNAHALSMRLRFEVSPVTHDISASFM